MDTNYTIDIIETQAGLEKIARIWEQLSAEDPDASVYSSYAFVSTAWRHFSRGRDRLFVLLLKKDGKPQAIAPFRITTERIWLFFKIRLIRYIAEWGNGDKPDIVAPYDKNAAWNAIAAFLNTYKTWEGLELSEQGAGAPQGDAALFDASRFVRRAYPASVSYNTSLKGTWDEYYAGLKPRVRENLKKSEKKIRNRGGMLAFTSHDSPERLEEALGRFITLEQEGWKRKRHFSVGGTEKQRAFHRDLLNVLATRGGISLYFLTVGAADIAASIVYRFKKDLYSAYVAYHPDWADCSPGMLLRSKILEKNFGAGYDRYDYLGLPESQSNQSGKMEWATSKQERAHIHVYKKIFLTFIYRIGLFISDNTRKTNVQSLGVLAQKIGNRLIQDRSAFLLCRQLDEAEATRIAALPILIRRMTPDDLPSISGLRNQECADRFRARMNNRKLGFVAEHNGRIVHYSWLSLENEYESWSGRWVRLAEQEAYVYDGYTAPDARGKGVYPAILCHIQEYLRRMNIRTLWIMIGRKNHASLQSARRAGFVPHKLYSNYLVLGFPLRLMCRTVRNNPR